MSAGDGILTPVTPAAPTGMQMGGIVAATFLACLFVLAIGLFGPNLDLAAISATLLLVGVSCLWRPGEPLTLLCLFGFQWLQGSMAIFLATFSQETVDEYFRGAGPVGQATALTLFALAAMSIGIRLVVGRRRPDVQDAARSVATLQPMRTWFLLYSVAWIAGAAAVFGGSLVSGLSQLLGGVNAFRWAFFFMLGAVHFSRGRMAGWWFPAAFVFEFAMGIGGYFSDFKTVFIVTFLSMTLAGTRLSLQRTLSLAMVAVSAIGLGVVWTAIKPDYRKFVSGGGASQTVLVGYPEQIQKLGELVSHLDDAKLSQATNELFARLSYVEFFGSTLSYVPAHAPHEGGALLLDAVSRPFTPRLLFPDKPEINDSERTRLYTGRQVAGSETGTSISLGWVAELYVDFGPWGMMLAAAGIGAFYGAVQRVLVLWTRSRGLLGYAASTSVLLAAFLLESSITKVIGGVIAALLAAVIVIYVFVPACCPWLVRKPT